MGYLYDVLRLAERTPISCVLLFEREGAFGNWSPSFWKRENHVSGEILPQNLASIWQLQLFINRPLRSNQKVIRLFSFFTQFLNRTPVHLLQRFNGGKDPFPNTSSVFVFLATVAMGLKKKMASKSKIAEAQGACSARTSGDDQVPAPSSPTSSTNGKVEPLKVGSTNLSSPTLDWRSVFHP